MAKILMVDDDPALVKSVKRWLELEGHAVEAVGCGEDALQMLNNYRFDVIVLDWQLPTISGLEVMRQFRSTGATTPVIFLTGQTEVERKKEGLDSGADDYLTKPFHADELGARIRSLLRRSAGVSSNSRTIGNVTIDIGTHTVQVDGAQVTLGKKELAVLEFLVRNANRCFSAQELLESVWPSDTDSSEGSVRTLMLSLRRKITDSKGVCIIGTIHGAGYIVQDSPAK